MKKVLIGIAATLVFFGAFLAFSGVVTAKDNQEACTGLREAHTRIHDAGQAGTAADDKLHEMQGDCVYV